MTDTATDTLPKPSAIDRLKALRDGLQARLDEEKKAAATGADLKPAAVTAEQVTKSVVGNKQVQDALGVVAEVFHKSGFAALITSGLKSLDTEVLDRSLASLGNVGAGIDSKGAPEAVVQAEKTAKAAREANGAGLVLA